LETTRCRARRSPPDADRPTAAEWETTVKAILTGILAAVALAICAAVVMDTEFQKSSADRFQTEGVRL
jgi:hypothetical protein